MNPKRYPLPGGGHYEILHARNAIFCYIGASETAQLLARHGIEEAVHRFFRETDIRTFRMRHNPPRLPEFMPRVMRHDGNVSLGFSDGSHITLGRNGCYPIFPVCGQPGWKSGRRREEYKAFRFFKVIGEERAREALKRWSSGGTLEVVEQP